jgi:hypothetical protein
MILNCKSAFVTLATTNFEALIGFYQLLLERSPHPYIPQVYAEFQLPDLRLGIFQPKQSHSSEFANQFSSMSLCLEVENLEATIAEISPILSQFDGSRLGEIAIASHGKEIYVYDPDGNRLILHESI